MVALAERDRGSLSRQMNELRRMQKTNPILRDDSWAQYGSTVEDYQRTFDRVLNGNNIIDYLANRSSPVVIDLMSPADTLADLFKKMPPGPKYGIAVSLKDNREEYEKGRDKNLGITQVAGDITQSQTWGDVEQLLQGRKVDLLMERAIAGLSYIPVNEQFFAIMLSRMWRLLSRNNGIMLLQTPASMDMESNDIRDQVWIDLLFNEEVMADYKTTDQFPWTGVLKIIKTPHSPEELPTLPRG